MCIHQDVEKRPPVGEGSLSYILRGGLDEKTGAVAMERKSVIVVRWKSNGNMETFSSLAAFCARFPQYNRDRIYNNQVNGIYSDDALELRRCKFNLNPHKTRRGNLKRAKPGPRRGPYGGKMIR